MKQPQKQNKSNQIDKLVASNLEKIKAESKAILMAEPTPLSNASPKAESKSASNSTPISKLKPAPISKLRSTPISKLRSAPKSKLIPTPISKLKPAPISKLKPTPISKIKPTPKSKIKPTPKSGKMDSDTSAQKPNASNLILLKAASYCAYQERCHNEVKHKLAEWEVYGVQADMILSQLIELNYLNEERFATTFAGGKFRVKHWGRLKIRRELKIRGIADYCIQKAMKEIDESDYYETLKALAVKKNENTKAKHPLERKQKIYHFLATKGYEADLISDILKDVFG